MLSNPAFESLDQRPALRVTDAPARGVFDAMFATLDAASSPVIGPAHPRLLVIPMLADDRTIIGGLWGVTLFRWLQIEMLVVPETMRFHGIGTALMRTAEAEARTRQCIGIHVDALSFQAAPFYQKCGFTLFGTLEDCPPGHQRLYFQKRLT